MEDLIRLDRRRPVEPTGRVQPLQANSSPLRWQEWDVGLSTHPDQRFRQYIVNGIQEGFRVGFDYRCQCWPSRRNIKSAMDNPQVIAQYVESECRAGRVVGPLSMEEFPFVHISRFGVIPKSAPGKWRLIVDMSSPEGGSVNDGIQETMCSLSYATVDDATQGYSITGLGHF